MPIDLDELIAPEGFKPSEVQSASRKPVGVAGWAKPPVKPSPDLERIKVLPRRAKPTGARAEALVRLMTSRFGKVNYSCSCSNFGRECIKTLRVSQAWTLYELGITGGILGGIGVGHGKTIAGILAPLACRNCQLALLLIPPTLVGQLIAEYQLVGQHFEVPSLVVHGRNVSFIQDAKPVLHVLPYSRLCMPGNSAFVEQLKPDLIIADECHKLRNLGTATTSRVFRYFRAHPETRFAGWTGSITDSSIQDYAHLSVAALRERSPVPIDPMTVTDWARALDAGEFPAPPGALFDLCEPGEHVRHGYNRRLTETLGCVVTEKPAIDAAVTIQEREAPTIPGEVEDALDAVRETWQRPDGEELVEALDVAKCARELACGFYYRWKFIHGETTEQIEEWLDARKAYAKELRQKLTTRDVHLDSPLLCWNAARRAHEPDAWKKSVREEYERALAEAVDPSRVPKPELDLPVWPALTWKRWAKVKKGVKPITEPVWVSDYLAQDCAAWARETRGVVWYSYRAFGVKIAEVSGLPMHGGGPKAGELIAAERGDRSIVASIASHGTGRDGLQRLFDRQLVANPPSSATAWEQLLGRLHRIGQKSPHVVTDVYQHTPELSQSLQQAVTRARYVRQTLGTPQKILDGWAGA